MPFVTSLNYCLACWSHVTKWNVLCSTHWNTEGVIYFKWHSKPFNIRLRTPCTNIFVGALGLRYVQIHSAAWCYHYCGHVHATFMKAAIYLSKYVFSNCLSFFVGGKWRHYNVTIKRGYMDSPFSSISTPFYCLFGADGDVLHLGEGGWGIVPTWFRSWNGSAISFDWRWNLGKTQIHSTRELGKT